MKLNNQLHKNQLGDKMKHKLFFLTLKLKQKKQDL